MGDESNTKKNTPTGFIANIHRLVHERIVTEDDLAGSEKKGVNVRREKKTWTTVNRGEKKVVRNTFDMGNGAT